MPNKSKNTIPFYKLFIFADRVDVVLMVVGSVAAVGNGITQPLMTLFMGQIIDSFATSHAGDVVRQVSKVSLKFFFLAIYTGIVSLLQVSCWIVTGERQASRIRRLYLETILKQDIAFFDTETTTGEVIGRLSGDTVLIQDAMGEKVAKFIQLMATFFGGFTIAFIRGWKLALVLLACIPAIVLAGGIMALIMAKMSSRAQLAYAQAGNVVEETVGAIRTVASFTGEKDAIRKYKTKLQVAYRSTVYQGLASGVGRGTITFLIFGTYALAVWYGSKMIIHNGYNGGQVVNIIMALMAGGMCLGQTSPCLNAFAAGQAAAYKMLETINREPRIDASKGIVLEDMKGEIELKEVHFHYPSRPDVEIFSGFSLHIPSGTTAALVGQSGSGKSTVISLVERFYDPDAGQVMIDGVDLKLLRLSWARRKIGLVSQEPVLFTTTIKENIKYGKEDANAGEIRSAVEHANAAKFIDKLPQGLDTLVGEHGTQLSGGQKQRIAIARAILRNPKILLLDEATSALDAESERVVQEALDRIMLNRTTVVVAHRLTTIKNADIIAVIHQGKVVEQGTHEELIQDSLGAYSKLVNERTMWRRSGSHRLSMRRSISTDSSSGRRSFPISNATIPNGSNRKDDGEANVKLKKVSFKRLAYLNKPELLVLLLGSVAASVNGVIFPVFGLLLSSAINIFYEPQELLHKDSRLWALIYLALAFTSLVIIPGQNFFFGIAGGRLIRRIRLLTFEKVVHEEISWFDDPANSSGAIGARLSTDAANVRGLVGDQLALIMQNIATIVAGLVIAFTANWILALIVLSMTPIMFSQGYFQAKFMRGFSSDAKLMYEEASQVANDAVGGIRTVASFCSESKVMELYENKCEGPLRQGVRKGLVSGFGFGFSFFALYCVNALCFYIGALLINQGKAKFSDVFKVFFALTISATGLAQSSSMAIDSTKAKDSVASIFNILDRAPKIDSSCDQGVTLGSVRGDVEFRHVSFKYPTRTDVHVFKGLCLSIPSKKTVALVGESGCGKSTIISLIERFYDVDSGHILLDGVDIQKLNLSWLRLQIGMVSQEPILFNGTIRANIAYGKQAATEDEIVKAARSANAHAFISGLPRGYDTSVGERGVQLSGGQKQRIAMARAIVKDPRILVLDEATSALDAESERVVQEALDRVTVDRTTLVVAHRLTTVKSADVIAVVKDGVVAEKGKHEELIKLDGAYASLVALQIRATSM